MDLADLGGEPLWGDLKFLFELVVNVEKLEHGKNRMLFAGFPSFLLEVLGGRIRE